MLWRNLYAGPETPENELVGAFEANARRLPSRRNGNVLYHEILAFSRGVELSGDALARAMADIGEQYLERRAPDQLAYGVIHKDTEHVHLHLMISANPAGKSDRIRLAKSDFAQIQRDIEGVVLAKYPELAQTRVYSRERSRERLKTDVHEQAMKVRTGRPSQKEHLKGQLHGIFERANSLDDLAKLLSEARISIYTRGKSIGVVVRDARGTERRHRLSTLGLVPHYEATNRRLAERTQVRSTPSNPERSSATMSRIREEPSMPIPPVVADTIEKTADTAQKVQSRVGEVVKEEVRFGKEVLKDFVFGPDRADRQPGHAKPEEPKKTAEQLAIERMEARLAELEATRRRRSEAEKDLEPEKDRDRDRER